MVMFSKGESPQQHSDLLHLAKRTHKAKLAMIYSVDTVFWERGEGGGLHTAMETEKDC